MNTNIQRLIYLCQVKNDLNRKRRRFYYYMNKPHMKRKCDGSKDKCLAVINKTGYPCRGYHYHPSGEKHIPVDMAMWGYHQAQKQMKAMTREMRSLRLELGATLIWSDWGAVAAVKVGDSYIRHREFKGYYEAEVFEMETFR